MRLWWLLAIPLVFSGCIDTAATSGDGMQWLEFEVRNNGNTGMPVHVQLTAPDGTLLIDERRTVRNDAAWNVTLDGAGTYYARVWYDHSGQTGDSSYSVSSDRGHYLDHDDCPSKSALLVFEFKHTARNGGHTHEGLRSWARCNTY